MVIGIYNNYIYIYIYFILGYYTKLNTFLVWLFTISLHNRNIFVLHGGDLYQRCILFFAMFLPLGACYSIDNILEKKSNIMIFLKMISFF